MITFVRRSYLLAWLLLAACALSGCALPWSDSRVASARTDAATPTIIGEQPTASAAPAGEAPTIPATLPPVAEQAASPAPQPEPTESQATPSPEGSPSAPPAASRAARIIYLPLAYVAPQPTPAPTATAQPSPTELVIALAPSATPEPPTATPQPEPPTPMPPPPPPSVTAVPPTVPPNAPPSSAPPAAAQSSPTRLPTQAAAGAQGDSPQMHLRTDLPAMSLQDWPRPANDNGRCMHFLRNQYFVEDELHINVQRLQQLGARWTLVVYADENIIKMAAPVFKQAGIIPIWRKMLRAHQPYYDWARDVELVKSYGLPPYFQLYNEPSLLEEWELSDHGPNMTMFTNNLMQASQDVYNAGGYVGWQFVNQEWLDHAIDEVQRRGGQKLFERFFFIPHPYGMNFPPTYTTDGRGILSYRYYMDQLERRLGFRPMMIAGEGGWKINNTESAEYPPINDESHRQYHVELFDWFRTGQLSNGYPLPDELLAYCVWLIADRGDDNAWWDSFAGNRQATIDAVTAMPPFTRRFSWER